jgi:hypothetical protein
VPLLLPLTFSLLHVGTVSSVVETVVENAGRPADASAACLMPIAPDPADALRFGDQTILSVIDGIEDGVAVVLVGADEREVTCSADALPSGVRAGGAVRLQLVGDRILHMVADPDQDAARAARIGAKLEWLRGNRDGKP